jgi:hypothetical protein
MPFYCALLARRAPSPFPKAYPRDDTGRKNDAPAFLSTLSASQLGLNWRSEHSKGAHTLTCGLRPRTRRRNCWTDDLATWRAV